MRILEIWAILVPFEQEKIKALNGAHDIVYFIEIGELIHQKDAFISAYDNECEALEHARLILPYLKK